MGTPPAFGAGGAGRIISSSSFFIITCIRQCTCTIIISRFSFHARAGGEAPPAEMVAPCFRPCCRLCLRAAPCRGHAIACTLACGLLLSCSQRMSQSRRRAMLERVCIAGLCAACIRKHCWAVCTSVCCAALMRAGWHSLFACQSVRVCVSEQLCCAAAAWPAIVGWASAGSWHTIVAQKGGFLL